MPIIRVSDKEKIRLIKVVDSCKTLSCAFRTWDLCEYLILSKNTSHSWTIMSRHRIEIEKCCVLYRKKRNVTFFDFDSMCQKQRHKMSKIVKINLNQFPLMLYSII